MKTKRQTIYAALNIAMTGPKNGDPRRDSQYASDRLEYLTDAVIDALAKRETAE